MYNRKYLVTFCYDDYFNSKQYTQDLVIIAKDIEGEEYTEYWIDDIKAYIENKSFSNPTIVNITILIG